MSLEKHYRAAEEAVIAMVHLGSDSPGSCGVCRRRAKAAVDALLSSLADDPPEEMVEAGAAAIAHELLPSEQEAGEPRFYASLALSAALREVSGGRPS